MPDYAFGPGQRHSRGPVLEAYAETSALEVPCVNCGAEVGVWCCHDPGVGGMPRKLPCPKRIQAAVRAHSNTQPQTGHSTVSGSGDAAESHSGDLRAEK